MGWVGIAATRSIGWLCGAAVTTGIEPFPTLISISKASVLYAKVLKLPESLIKEISSFTSFIPKDVFWSATAVEELVFFTGRLTADLPATPALEGFALAIVGRDFCFCGPDGAAATLFFSFFVGTLRSN